MFLFVCFSLDDDASSDSEGEGQSHRVKPRFAYCCKQKARLSRRHKGNSNNRETESEEEEEEEEEEAEEEEEESDISEASESADVGISGFLDDEAMEVEVSSSEEWVEGSGESDGWLEGEGQEGQGLLDDEAEEEEVYQARKRRRRRRRRVTVLSDDDSCSESNAVSAPEESLPKKRCCEVGALRTHSFLKESKDSEEEEEAGDVGVVMDEGEELEDGEGEGSVSADSGEQDEGKGGVEEGGGVAKPRKGGGSQSLKWKEDLVAKATRSFAQRTSTATNLRRLIYSDTPLLVTDVSTMDDDDEEEEEGVGVASRAVGGIGGLFQLAKKKAVTVFHMEDISLLGVMSSSSLSSSTPSTWDATAPSIVGVAKTLFVTGNWGAEGAKALLDEDDALYGDFEDIEGGERSEGGGDGGVASGEEAEVEEEGEEEEQEKRLEKKRRLKASFDTGYDEEGGDYLDDLKREVSEQEQRNREEFEGMDDQTRLQYEGVRPGYYVRVELKSKEEIFMFV